MSSLLSPKLRRVLFGVAGLSILSILLISYRQTELSTWLRQQTRPHVEIETPSDPKAVLHPIEELIRTGNTYFDDLLRKETFDLGAAARRYREVRGRHPPPGFGKWYQYAKKNNVIFVEEFWDQLYHDTNPLWGLNPSEMRNDALAQDRQIKVRNGNATRNTDFFWLDIWEEFIQSVAKDLPDMDLAFNTMDEPRMLVPWEDMAKYVHMEREKRGFFPKEKVSDKFTPINATGAEDRPTENFPWDGTYPVWTRHAAPCAPDSAARIAFAQDDFSLAPQLATEHMRPHLYKGYVSNYTLSTSICHQPDLQGLHGYLVEPISVRTTPKYFPMFGSSKLSVNSEILIPAAMYYGGDERFKSTAPPVPWDEKNDVLFWRGLASGGRNKIDNWKSFHRHRLVSMVNGTQAIAMPSSSGFIDIQSLPLELWHLQSWANDTIPKNVAMGEWLTKFVDVGVMDLACFPEKIDSKLGHFGCAYTGYLFEPLPGVNLPEQHKNKYLVDVDGNSFSGRYLDFLQSGSIPIKATLFREWHDSRLVAWKHFVPMDNRFMDIYGIMEFFLGFEKDVEGKWKGHDHLAKKIAEEGADWARKVLRKEDMRVYMYRLLLEYARIMDPKREELGWVDDIKT